MGKSPMSPGARGTSVSRRALRSKSSHGAEESGDGESFEVNLLQTMLAFRSGDFSFRLPIGWTGVEGKIADAFNEVASMSERRARQAAHVARVVGKEGRLRERMSTSGFVGRWAEEVEALNTLMDDLARPTTEVTRTIGAVAKGDLGQMMALGVDATD